MRSKGVRGRTVSSPFRLQKRQMPSIPLMRTSNADPVEDAMDDGIGFFGFMIILAIVVVVIAAVWRVYEKAGQPGWAALVPIYNMYVVLQIVGRPGWWLFLYFIPLVNIAVTVIVYIDLAKSFGKSPLFGLGLTFLSIIFVPILAFGDARYEGQVA